MTFDIFMRFSKYFTDRNIAEKYYNDINAWTLEQILAKVDVKYDDIKMNGIIIMINGEFECSIWFSSCHFIWQFVRYAVYDEIKW